MSRSLLALALLAGCGEPEPEIAYLVETLEVASFLDDDTPRRTWSIHLESDELAARDGVTWSTLRVETTVVVGDSDPWQETSVRAWLTSDVTLEDGVQFSAPGADGLSLFDEAESDCVMGEPCSWDWQLGMERTTGHGEVGLDLVIRGLISLGPREHADPFAELDLLVEETTDEGEDTGAR